MKYKILKLLKEKNDYVSGEELGGTLGISRAAVWKNIAKLKEEGYSINSVSKRGYKLSDCQDILNEGEISYDKLVYLKETDSTNEECKRQAAKGCEEGLLVVSDYQSAGKGRLGRSWSSEQSDGLYMSMVLKPDISPIEAPQLTLVAGLAVCKAIESITGLTTGLKWPNDVIVNGRKICGILTEMSAEMECVKYVVIGIGINVNKESFDGELSDKATSVYIETGKKYKRSVFIDLVTKELLELYSAFSKNGFEYIKDEYNSRCLNVGRSVRTVGKYQKEGIALGVNSRGELLIDTENGVESVLSGEVSLRLDDYKYI